MMKDLRKLDNKIKIVAHMDIKIIEEHRRLYSPFGLSPTLNVVGGGGQQPKIILPVKEKRNENY